ncbi:MAG: type II toxin-antitoxin system RelE/ParE family toxin [Candidatus Omnitrophica bacterium]|nr:type II toxin-antitoxin system RelE/ParE family toxin [Candidatus Omnitrophota bacterium]
MSTVKYEIVLQSQAEKYYLKVDPKTAKQLDRCFENLENNPIYYPARIKRLAGQKGLWRYRVNDLRVIYEIIQEKKLVVVLAILPRGDAYKKI